MMGRNGIMHSLKDGPRLDRPPYLLAAGTGTPKWLSIALSWSDPEWLGESPRRKLNWLAVAIWSSSLIVWGVAAMSIATDR
jgi:hypothetical protein